jgi:hypothetical protein
MALGFITALTTPALGYPTAVIFAPTGDSKALGDMNALMYASSTFSPRAANGERFSPSSTWSGALFGVVPSLRYGQGYEFGGLELGADVFWPDSSGQNKMKPVFNLKANILKEKGLLPFVGVGMMQISTMSHQRLNFGYLSFTKTLQFGETSYGRVTVGLANSFAKASARYDSNCPASAESGEDFCMFRGTTPFRDSSSLALLAGYESPSFGPFSLAIDHIGGYSEISSTNLALNFTMAEGTILGVGAFFGNERRRDVLLQLGALDGKPSDGLFVYLSATRNLIKLFSGDDKKP